MANSFLNIEAEATSLAAIMGAGSVAMVIMDVVEWPVFLVVALLVFAAKILWTRKR